MRIRTLSVGAAIGLVVWLVPAPAHAAPATYRVSIAVSAAKADVGQSLKVTGKVTGPRAGRKQVHVQQRIGMGAWRTVKKVRTTASGRYSSAVKVTTAGAQSLRVVAPKSKVRRAGTSAARQVMGWRWIEAVRTGAVHNLRSGSVRVHGATYSGLTVAPRDSGRLLVRFDGRCNAVSYAAGVGGEMNNWALIDLMQGQGASLAPALARIEPWVSGGNEPLSSTWALRGESDHLEFGLFSSSQDQRAVLISPRLHCNVNSLPRTTMPSGA